VVAVPRRPVDDDGQVISIPAVVVEPFHEPPIPIQATNPGVFDLEVYRGDTMEWIFQLWASVWSEVDGGWVQEGAPIDVSLWRFKAEIRSGIDGELFAGLQRMVPVDPRLTLDNKYGRAVALQEMAEGWVRMRLTANQSRQLKSGVWDLEGTTPDGWVKTLIRGAVIISGDVTTGNVKYLGGA
jgi:hypothetical protein